MLFREGSRVPTDSVAWTSTHPGERTGAITWNTQYGIWLYGGYVNGDSTGQPSDQLWIFEEDTQAWLLVNDPLGSSTESGYVISGAGFHSGNTPGKI